MKKITAMLLITALTALLAVSCGSDPTAQENSKPTVSAAESSADASSQSETSASSEESDASEIDTDPLSHIEQQNLDKTITFLVVGDEYDRYKSVEILPHEDSPELISDAVAERNTRVEERLGVKIDEVRVTVDQMLSRVRNELSAPTGEFDVVMPYLYTAATLSAESAFYDLNEFSDIIRFDAPYWNARACSDLSILDRMYFATGDFSLLSFECTHAIVFNKSVLGNIKGESPYKLVEDKNWTYDTLLELSRQATAERDNVDGMTYKDAYGFWVDGDYILSMFIGSGERMSSKDSDGLPYITIASERAPNVIDKLVNLVNDKTASFHIESCHTQAVSDGEKDCYYAATKAFAEGRALFRSLSLVDLHELSDFEVDFGILPTPMYDSNQESYHCFGSTMTVTAAAIPVSGDDPQTTALVLEAMAAASQNTVRYAYYEVLLKSRKIRDDESEKMLDIIFSNRVYDLADIYNWGTIRGLVIDTVTSGQNTFASKWEAAEDNIKSLVEDTIDVYSR